MQVKTLKQIEKLRYELPEFNVLDWFEVHNYASGILIKSGLRHADGETMSPAYYESFTFGLDHKQIALRKFNEFLNTLDPNMFYPKPKIKPFKFGK